METISVVMITYNHENYIEEAIQSILLQKVDCTIDFIISNDNSSDNSHNIIENLIKNVPENFVINYTYHSENLGMMPNFIWALQQARGKYIAICDGDDYWIDSLKLSKQLQFLEENKDFSFCFHNAKNFIEKENRFVDIVDLDKHTHLSEANNKILFKRLGGAFPTSSAFFKAEYLQPFPEYFKLFNVTDSPLILTGLLNGKIGYSSEKMSVYRTTLENWSAKNNLFENKWKNYQYKIETIESFDELTNRKFNNQLKLSKDHLNYQIIYAYFKINPEKSKRFRFVRNNYQYLSLKNSLKIIIRLLQK
ncbi:glycosyltransferase [Epilithonimonas sp.]|uniref:glycosyltransferase n=1 Tax=Epilithonimonas sp. TaxID=2894511 RepID=UPI0028986BA9|nr:glycosyltransferase [Epilithonimonas sp.]